MVVDGVGNGHGRGLSQWGSYGWAVNYGWDWTQILDHYYGGTTMGDAANNRITVRLLALDDQQTAVISATGTANWGADRATTTRSSPARSAASTRSTARRLAGTSCPPRRDRRCRRSGRCSARPVRRTTGAPGVTFTTPAGDDPGAAPGDVLGVCGAGGIVDHYRGSIYAANGTAGENRTVNSVLIESYLRGVVPRESPASWGARRWRGRGQRAPGTVGRRPVVRVDAGPVLVREDLRQLGVPGLRRRRLAGLGVVDERDVARARADRRRDRGDGRQGPSLASRRDRVDRVLGVQRPAHRRRFVPGGRRSGRLRAGQPAAPLDPCHRRRRPRRPSSTSAR